MKKWTVILFILGILATLTACNTAVEPEVEDIVISTTEVEETTVSTDTTVATETTAATEETTVPAPQIVELEETYYVKIQRSDFPIHSGPGAEHPQVTTVKEAGIYTIVAEYAHPDGTLWGRLKSGVGWVNLDLINNEKHDTTIVTAAHADRALLSGGNYHYFSATSSPYSIAVAFRTNNLVYNVSFFQFILGNSGFESGPVLFQLDHWDSGKPFVADLSLDGPGAAWGLKFTDGSGTTQTYILQDGGGLEENKDKLTFKRYTKAYTTYSDPSQTSLASWQTAYLNYIESLGSEKTYCEYRLVFVDSDSIPELFIHGSCEASGSRICSFKGGSVVTTHLRRLGGGSYIPKSGLVCNFNGNMGYYTMDIVRLTANGFTSLFSADQEDTYETVINENGEEEYITKSRFYLYDGSGKIEVTENEFYNAADAIFDSNTAEALYHYNDGTMSNYNSIRELIKNW